MKYIIMFLLLPSCAGRVERDMDLDEHIYINGNFNSTDLDKINAGITEWKKAIPAFNPIIETGSVSEGTAIIDAKLNHPLLGWTYNGEEIISVKLDIASAEATMKETVEHELGHAMGLHHLPYGLMLSTARGISCIDQYTLDILYDLRGWVGTSTCE